MCARRFYFLEDEDEDDISSSTFIKFTPDPKFLETLDIMSRSLFLKKLRSLIESSFESKSSTWIMLNGEWGSGKTFVLKMLNTELDQDYFIIEYNCWENSYHSDPLEGILLSMWDTISKSSTLFTNSDKDKIRKIINIALEFLSIPGGIFALPREIKEILTKNTSQENINTLTTYIQAFKEYFNKLLKQEKIIILIDELDRCFPEYAIKTMERLFLLFKDFSNIVLIIGANCIQLSSSIESIFGSKMNLESYLDKFIDYTMTLDFDRINIDKFIEKNLFFFTKFKLYIYVNTNRTSTQILAYYDNDKSHDTLVITDQQIDMEHSLKLLTLILRDYTQRQREELIKKANQIYTIAIANSTEKETNLSICLFLLILLDVGINGVKQIFDLDVKNREKTINISKLEQYYYFMENILSKYSNNQLQKNEFCFHTFLFLSILLEEHGYKTSSELYMYYNNNKNHVSYPLKLLSNDIYALIEEYNFT